MVPAPTEGPTPRTQLSQPDLDWDFEYAYASGRELDLPWFTPTLDEEFDFALEHYGIRAKTGPVLDLGTGPGTAAIELAKRGYEVYALDASKNALKMARRRAGPVAKQIKWVQSDMFGAQFEKPLQMVYDRGLYHSLPEGRRREYPAIVGTWIKDRGLLFLKCFSPEEPGDWGPNRIPEGEVRTNFASTFDLVKVEHTKFPSTLDHDPRANFYVLRRRVGERAVV